MVVSAFESVAGLAGATPYISLALKAVSRHFNHLKNAISDQLKQLKTFLGEDFSSPQGGDLIGKRLKYNDHSFQKHKSSGSANIGLLEPQQHIWRPQRGLPERAVSVLRAWLFEHFLHPYVNLSLPFHFLHVCANDQYIILMNVVSFSLGILRTRINIC